MQKEAIEAGEEYFCEVQTKKLSNQFLFAQSNEINGKENYIMTIC